MSYTYTHERNYDKWETLSDVFDEMLDELNEDEDTENVFVDVDSFDEYEVL
jgi:CRISPR/Cas system CSM-associated protein Csm2 small subunit